MKLTLMQSTDLSLTLETIQHSSQGDKDQTDAELEVLRMEIASVE
jgi:hypothetical protein